jgi:hypothetical protein
MRTFRRKESASCLKRQSRNAFTYLQNITRFSYYIAMDTNNTLKLNSHKHLFFWNRNDKLGIHRRKEIRFFRIEGRQ